MVLRAPPIKDVFKEEAVFDMKPRVGFLVIFLACNCCLLELLHLVFMIPCLLLLMSMIPRLLILLILVECLFEVCFGKYYGRLVKFCDTTHGGENDFLTRVI